MPVPSTAFHFLTLLSHVAWLSRITWAVSHRMSRVQSLTLHSHMRCWTTTLPMGSNFHSIMESMSSMSVSWILIIGMCRVQFLCSFLNRYMEIILNFSSPHEITLWSRTCRIKQCHKLTGYLSFFSFFFCLLSLRHQWFTFHHCLIVSLSFQLLPAQGTGCSWSVWCIPKEQPASSRDYAYHLWCGSAWPHIILCHWYFLPQWKGGRRRREAERLISLLTLLIQGQLGEPDV